MRVIEEYTIKPGGIEVEHYDDHAPDDTLCDVTFVSNESVKKAFEALGFGYSDTGYNSDMTDVVHVMLCKEGDEIEFILGEIENSMETEDIHQILKKAIELI